SQEPRAKSQEPRAKSQEPRAKSQEPRAKSQEPLLSSVDFCQALKNRRTDLNTFTTYILITNKFCTAGCFYQRHYVLF
ncbi:MAG: hypothetical protein LBG79_00830, partial [Spirochaetaceae bacterium]|nr:hypothetical protein [Spirochaetaceae bacterium]